MVKFGLLTFSNFVDLHNEELLAQRSTPQAGGPPLFDSV
jgi:hypothetical protein